MRIGFVGAGLMGAPMVRRLVEAGHDVVVSSRRPQRLSGTGWNVVGSPAETAAGAGTLAIWVGGSAAGFERARPVLEVLGDPAKIRHCGASGAGLVVKLANNYLGAVNAAASAEALAMAREAPVLTLTRTRFEAARDRYGDDVDYGAVARLAGW